MLNTDMRLFFAVEISAGVREALSRLQDELRPRFGSARWVRPSNLHLTLRFLGESEPGVVKELGRRLPERVRAFDSFTLRFRGVRAFPNVTRPRVLWVSIDRPNDALNALQAAIEDEVRSLGLSPEKRPFRPHLTIARFKRHDKALTALAPGISERGFGATVVSEVILFESRLAREGASYHVAERFRLGGTEREQLV